MVKHQEILPINFVKKLIVLVLINVILFSQSNLSSKEKLFNKKPSPNLQDSKDIQFHTVNEDYSLSFEKPKFWDFITLTPTTFKNFSSIFLRASHTPTEVICVSQIPLVFSKYVIYFSEAIPHSHKIHKAEKIQVCFSRAMPHSH